MYQWATHRALVINFLHLLLHDIYQNQKICYVTKPKLSKLLMSDFICKIGIPITRKSKYRDENIVFDRQWTMQFLFIKSNGKPLCLVCHGTIAVLKEYNLKRLYRSRHEAKHNIRGQEREDKINPLNVKVLN